MFRDEHRTESSSKFRPADDDSPKLVLTHDDELGLAETPIADTSPGDEPVGEVKSLSPSQRRRRQRAQKLLLAIVLAGVFVTLVTWSRGVRHETSQTQVLSIAPRVLFEKVCAQVRKGQGDTLHISEYPVDDEMVSAMAGLDSLETVIFDEGAITDASIETIASLPNLQHLRLRLSPIGDEGMKRLAKIDSLWYLNLPHAECTAQGVAELAASPGLRQLRLGSNQLGNEVTREIAKIPYLRSVHLIGIAVTDEGLKALASMEHLESLYLDDSAVTEAGWEWLFREHPHLHVHVDQAHHDRDPKGHKHH
jgi:hypothetical protein